MNTGRPWCIMCGGTGRITVMGPQGDAQCPLCAPKLQPEDKWFRGRKKSENMFDEHDLLIDCSEYPKTKVTKTTELYRKEEKQPAKVRHWRCTRYEDGPMASCDDEHCHCIFWREENEKETARCPKCGNEKAVLKSADGERWNCVHAFGGCRYSWKVICDDPKPVWNRDEGRYYCETCGGRIEATEIKVKWYHLEVKE